MSEQVNILMQMHFRLILTSLVQDKSLPFKYIGLVGRLTCVCHFLSSFTRSCIKFMYSNFCQVLPSLVQDPCYSNTDRHSCVQQFLSGVNQSCTRKICAIHTNSREGLTGRLTCVQQFLSGFNQSCIRKICASLMQRDWLAWFLAKCAITLIPSWQIMDSHYNMSTETVLP